MPLLRVPLPPCRWASRPSSRSPCEPRAIARRLMELGLVPGTRVSVTRVAPLGDPLELHLRNYALSIRRADALSIESRRA